MPTSLWTPTPDLDDTIAEFDLEFERLKLLQTDLASTEYRCALHGCIGAVYRMREHRRSAYGASAAYIAALQNDPVNSAIPEGVITARGKLQHLVTKAPLPHVQELYPGGNSFPGEYTYPGENLQWRNEFDPLVVNAGFDQHQLGRYRAIAGAIVLETLLAARTFFAGL